MLAALRARLRGVTHVQISRVAINMRDHGGPTERSYRRAA
jgi:hypothetical protein